MLVIGLGCVPGMPTADFTPALGLLLGVIAVWLLSSTDGAGSPARKITAGTSRDAEGRPRVFTLNHGFESVTLDPGKPWVKADEHKWVTRGVIEPPQSFHVLPGGTVEINGEKITLDDPEGLAKLEHEINKSHIAPIPHKPPSPSGLASPVAPQVTADAARAHFKVKLDHLGHLMIECARGAERVETGLRGLPQLVVNGLMLKPKALHVDPLQRAVELDGVRFECNEAGAHALQETLNARYASVLKAGDEHAIDVKENMASPTRFDIAFVTVHAGVRHEVRGHLSQEKLDLLQDPARSDLLWPGILLRLSPPFLLIRQRRPDGGEECIAEVPDIEYLRATAARLQQVFNHPRVRRSAGGAASHPAALSEAAAGFSELRVVRNPKNPLLLWLECHAAKGGPAEGKAFTHHNVADLQHRGMFAPPLDVSLSLDHRRLSILNTQTRQEEALVVDAESGDEVLARASRMLTAALKPPPSEFPPAPTAG
jgi:hypothetical protein